jgi:nitrite reductase (NADH) small subunit
MSMAMTTTVWTRVADASDFPEDGGAAVKFGEEQVAVFHFAETDTWYACQNLCPHKQQMVLARGIVGDKGGVPVVACPMHKRSFSLESGKCVDDDLCVKIYQVKVEGGEVYLAAE